MATSTRELIRSLVLLLFLRTHATASRARTSSLCATRSRSRSWMKSTPQRAAAAMVSISLEWRGGGAPGQQSRIGGEERRSGPKLAEGRGRAAKQKRKTQKTGGGEGTRVRGA